MGVDPLGNVFVADTNNHRIQKFDAQGNFLAMWGERGSGPKGLHHPLGLAVDRHRNLYVADTSGGKVMKFSRSGAHRGSWGDRGREFSRYASLAGIAAGPDGSVYATHTRRHAIEELDARGVFLYRQPIRYRFSSVNLGNYETVLIKAKIPPQPFEGTRTVARLGVSYTDLRGNRVRMDPVDLTAAFVKQSDPLDGISNAMVPRAGTMLHYAQALKAIGAAYREGAGFRALERANQIKKELLNAQERLGSEAFAEELELLGKKLRYSEPRITRIVQDRELQPASPKRGLLDHVHNLFRETVLDLELRPPGKIAVLGFSLQGRSVAAILELLSNKAESVLFEAPRITVLERQRIATVLSEQERSFSEVMNPGEAVRIGEMLAADYILAGSVVEMSNALAIFSRLINVETGAIESVSQIIVSRNEEVQSLL